MPGIDITEDSITFSQSWLNTFFNCPQQANLELQGVLPRVESDATAIGSAFHHGIEHVLRGGSTDSGWQAAVGKLEELMALPQFEFKQLMTVDGVKTALERVYWEWLAELYPQLPGPMAVEMPFDCQIDTLFDRAIRIKGAIDYVDENACIWDWKTTGSFRNWQQWEVDRFKIQPTFYSYGLMLSTDSNQFADDRVEFTYAVFNKSRQEHSLYTTTRGADDWDWLRRQLRTITKMIVVGLDEWPLRDQHALCSPKWCPAWDACKGSSYR